MEIVGAYKYNTKDLIGHGAFAVVFKGCQIEDSKHLVAVKRISKKNFSKSQNVFNKEIKILRGFSEGKYHPLNVVSLLDCVQTSNYVYLVMEYCNGGDLADYLNVQGTLSEETIKLFIRQTANALKALHERGVVHRDLKPQNILLCFPEPYSKNHIAVHPSNITLKIGDFGFARFLEDGVMAGTLCGSPMYMAPEVIMSKRYDGRADLWSVGTIVYQCLTGQAPFIAKTPQKLKQFYEKHANIQPNIPVNTSTELKSLLHGLLKRNPNERMTFDEFFNHAFLTQSSRNIEQSFSSSPPSSSLSALRSMHPHQRRLHNFIHSSSKPMTNPSSPMPIAKEMKRSLSPPLDDFVVVDHCGFVLEATSAPTEGSARFSPITSSSSFSSNYFKLDRTFSTFPRIEKDANFTGYALNKTLEQSEDMTTTLLNPHSQTCPDMAAMWMTSGKEYDKPTLCNIRDDYHDIIIPELKNFSPISQFADVLAMKEHARRKRSSLDTTLMQGTLNFEKLDNFNNHILSQDLLLDMKHNELVTKLEYISSLVESILSLIYLYDQSSASSSHNQPASVLCSQLSHSNKLVQSSSAPTDCSLNRLSCESFPHYSNELSKASVILHRKAAASATSEAGSQLTLLKPLSPSVYRRVFPPPPLLLEISIKQLLLYAKSLEFLLASLRMAAEEIRKKNLKTTRNVKQCIKKMKILFEICSENSSLLIKKYFNNNLPKEANPSDEVDKEEINNQLHQNAEKTDSPLIVHSLSNLNELTDHSTNQPVNKAEQYNKTFENNLCSHSQSHKIGSMNVVNKENTSGLDREVEQKEGEMPKQIQDDNDPIDNSSRRAAPYNLLTTSKNQTKDIFDASCLKLPKLGAERLIFKHALYCCQIATTEEIYGNSPNSLGFYHSALILLHTLVESSKDEKDETTLIKYKNLVERRLNELQS